MPLKHSSFLRKILKPIHLKLMVNLILQKEHFEVYKQVFSLDINQERQFLLFQVFVSLLQLIHLFFLFLLYILDLWKQLLSVQMLFQKKHHLMTHRALIKMFIQLSLLKMMELNHKAFKVLPLLSMVIYLV